MKVQHIALLLVFLVIGPMEIQARMSKEEIIEFMKKATLQEKIAQMVNVGFSDTAFQSGTILYNDIVSKKIGGVVIFERNIVTKQNLKTLVNKMQDAAKVPLFISVDEEGGYVSRLKEKYGFPPTYTAYYLGKAQTAKIRKFKDKRTIWHLQSKQAQE